MIVQSVPRCRRCMIVCRIAMLGVVGTSTSAQILPDAVQRTLVEMGWTYSAQQTFELFRPLLASAQKESMKVTKDVSYGRHPRNLLDVYQPEGSTKAPVLVFFHGGGYRNGDRDINEYVYGNVPMYFARHGMVGVNATYRLAPAAPWPAGAEDVRDVVAWVKKNAGQHGGDSNRIFLMGHSAGATHVATYVFDPRLQPGGSSGVTAAILVSGRYRVVSDPDDASLDGVRDYFGTDPARYPARSVVEHVPNSRIPVMLVAAEFDQRNLAATTGEMFAALCARDAGRCPRFVQLKYHNHLSEVYSINTSDDFLGREILEFIRQFSQASVNRVPSQPLELGSVP